jgi:sulfatase maturation enzyme AslB (radical SAM superfamily)
MKTIPILNQSIKKFAKKDIQGLMCPEPFNGISIATTGEVSMCGCQTWLPTIIGNIFDSSINEMLSSKLSHDIRNSIRTGTYEYCDETKCGIIVNNRLVSINDLTGREKEKFFDSSIVDPPRYVNIAGDKTCNLSCPSCRTQVINNDDDQDQKNKTVMSMILEQVFNGTSEEPVSVTISNEGEIFASRSMLNLLENFPIDRYPKLELFLQSNGLLLKSRWNRIEHLADNIYRLSITVDSQDPKTYEKLRRGGTFDKLIENLEFVKELLKEYYFEYSIRMVVQKDNMNEIEDFYNFAISYGAHDVEYLRLLEWGAYSPDIHKELDVLDINNPHYATTAQQLLNLKNKFDNVTFFNFAL